MDSGNRSPNQNIDEYKIEEELEDSVAEEAERQEIEDILRARYKMRNLKMNPARRKKKLNQYKQ